MEQNKEPFEKFYELFSQSPISIELSDSKGILQNINQQCIDLYGIVDTSDVINKYNLFEDPNIIDSVKERIKNKELVEYETVYDFNLVKTHNLYRTTKSGVIKLHATIAPLILGGKINGYIVATIDNTKQKEAEQKLKDSEEMFRILNEQSLMGITIIQGGRNVYVNKASTNILEYSLEEILNLSINDFGTMIHPDDYEFAIDQAKKKQAGEKKNVVSHYSYRLITKSKKIKWVDQYSKTIDYKGKPANFVTFIDINEQKIAEQKLRESEEKYRRLFESSPVGICISDFEGNVISINKAMGEITGYDLESFKHINLKSTYVNSNDHINLVKKLKETGRVRNAFVKLRKSSGVIYSALLNLETINISNRILLLSNVQDISERTKVENKLKELSKLKSELLTRTSHELKTPAMHIKGYADLLLHKHKKNLGIEELQIIGHIKKGVLRLETLIHDILHKAELDSGHGELNKAQNDLSSIIDLSVRELNSFAALREHSIILDINDSMIINFDREQIRHVINNLITNAIKYTPLNGIIGVNSIITDDFITIAIQDNGIGLTEEQTNMLFTHFGKIERFGQGFDIITEGSGLGLHIAKKIIDLHGGKIWAESGGINRGSTFYFSLPITKS